MPLADEAKRQGASHGARSRRGGVHSPLVPATLLADHNSTVAVYGIETNGSTKLESVQAACHATRSFPCRMGERNRGDGKLSMENGAQ